MAGNTDGEDLDEDKIDKMKMPAAVMTCKKREIDINFNPKPKLREMTWLIKDHALCKNNLEQIVKLLESDTKYDKEKRDNLIDIYENTKETLKNILNLKDDPLVKELQRLGFSSPDVFETEKEKLVLAKAPVLVLGETGAGKSSFINLLLEHEWLPCSILSNTHIVCEIMYSDVPKFCLYSLKEGEVTAQKTVEESEEVPRAQFIAELAEHIQKLENGRPVYVKAEVYLPSKILKAGLVIVDSPGVGESDEMKEVVLDYAVNACAYIYVIDIMNAGGMQQRMQEFLDEVYNRAVKDQKDYNPESSIFVCNKWDEVPLNEREEVWDDTKEKIKKYWRYSEDSQMFKFSAREALYIYKRSGRLSPKYRHVLDEINKLLPLGREVLVFKQLRYLECYAAACLHCLNTHLGDIGKTMKQRELKQSLVRGRLQHLQKDIDEFFNKKVKEVKSQISELAQQLSDYLRKEENMKAMCQISNSDVPSVDDWKTASIEIRSEVYKKMDIEIKRWEEKEGHFQRIEEGLNKSLEKEFPKFDREVFAVQKDMSGQKDVSSGFPEEDDDNDDEEFVPRVLKNKFHGLSFGKKFALGVGLAPVILVGMLVRIPVIGFRSLRRTFSSFNYGKVYSRPGATLEEKKSACERYARDTVTTIIDTSKLAAVIEEDMQALFACLNQQKQNLEEQIKNDLKMMNSLLEETRNDAHIQALYEPLKAKFKIMKQQLNFFRFKYLEKRQDIEIQNLQIIDETVWRFADIIPCESVRKEYTEGHVSIFVRKQRCNVSDKNFKRMRKICEAYTHIKKTEIVQCLGSMYLDKSLYQVLAPLQYSLRTYLDAQPEDMRVNKANTCLKIMKSVVSGLEFLHDRMYVHIDLSLDTVYVDMKNDVKLTNISLSGQPLSIVPVVKDNKFFPGQYVHLHPRFFSEKTVFVNFDNIKKFIVYEKEDDMYAVGIMMIELYREKRLVAVTTGYELDMKDPDTQGLKRDKKTRKSKERKPTNEMPVEEEEESNAAKFQKLLMKLIKEERQSLEKVEKEDSLGSENNQWIKWIISINRCLDQIFEARKFLQEWDDLFTYPALTINHF